jgi:AraC family transcriptional regulator
MNAIKRWVLGSGDFVGFRDEAEFERQAQNQVLAVLGDSRNTVAWNSWLPSSIWISLRGGARITAHDQRIELGPDDIYVAEHGCRLTVHALGPGSGTVLGLLLPAQAVRSEYQRLRGSVAEEPLLFPAVLRNEASLQLPLLRLAQAASNGSVERVDGGTLVSDLLNQILLRQSASDALVARCPGRSARYRRQLLLRLIRARNHIDAWQGQDAALARLAAIARLSPTHFLRLFQTVFGQTPHKYVVQVRLAAARTLLSRSELSVSDVCRTLGFENRCAFARVFRQHFGETPSQVRRQAATAAAGERNRGGARVLPFEARVTH